MKRTILNLGIVSIIGLLFSPALIAYGQYDTTQAPTESQALENYQLLAPLPCVGTSEDCSSMAQETNMVPYIEGFFKLAIGLSAVAAVVMIVVGGFQYLSSDAILKKNDGKKRIQNALIGLILVITAWVILNEVNPNLMNINLELEAPTTQALVEGSLSPALSFTQVDQAVQATCPNCSVAGGLTYNISEANLARFSCQTCSALPSSIPFSGSSANNTAPGTASALVGLNNGLRQQEVAWQVTEAFPPTVNHLDSCHYNGSCVDAKPLNPTPTNIKRFIDTAQNNGLSPSYEVKTAAEQASLIKDLQSLGMTNPPVVVNTATNGNHFHLEK